MLVRARGQGGRLIQVVFVLDEDGTAFVIHARPLTDREKRRFRRDGREMNKPSAYRKYSRMTAEELAAATAEFDADFDDRRFKPLDAQATKLWDKAKRKRGRPAIGKGVKVVSVSLEKGLLEATDKLAKRLGVSRAHLVAKGLKTLLEQRSRKRKTG